MKSFSELLNKEGPILGLYIQTTCPSIVETAKQAGFDFIRIDNEHVLFDYSNLAELIRTATLLDMPVQVRVSNLYDITKLLDFGATGIVVPDVNTIERARKAIEATKFYPIGSRGMFPTSRSVKMSGCSSFEEYVKIANDLVTLTIQIEDVKVAEYIDEIVSMDGIDMIASGKADISQSAGIPGQTNHPIVKEMEDLIVKKALEYGKQPVILVRDKNRIKELLSIGVKVFMLGSDADIIFEAFKDTVYRLVDV